MNRIVSVFASGTRLLVLLWAVVLPVTCPTPLLAASPVLAVQSCAFGGANYLAGIENFLTTPSTIWAQMLSPDGVPVGSLIPTGRSGIATNVAFDGTNYLLIWEDDGLGRLNGTTGWQVYGQFITTAGAPVGAPFPISSLGVWFDGVKVMAFGGNRYLVTYTKLIDPARGDAWNNRYIAGRIVNPDGTMGNEFRISSGFGAASDVTFGGAGFFVVWRDDMSDREIRGRFVSLDGVPGSELSVNASPAPSDNPVSVAFDGTNYLVVWNDDVGSPGSMMWNVFGQLVSPSGTLVGGVIPVTPEPGSHMVTTVAFDGATYLAVWIDQTNDANGNGACDAGEGTCWDVYGQYISRSGALVGGKTAIAVEPGNQMGGVSGYANGKYLVIINSGVVFEEGSSALKAETAYGRFLQPPDLPREKARYNPVTGEVLIPGLQIQGDTSATVYTVGMRQESELDFTLTSITAVPTGTATPDTAVYNPSLGTCLIPALSVEGDASGASYYVTLQQQGQTLRFTVTGMTPD